MSAESIWTVGILTAILMLFLFKRSLFGALSEPIDQLWRAKSMSSEVDSLWDIRLKLLAILGVIVSAVWAVHSYNDTAERELRKSIWDKQIALYFEATEATATIAASQPDDAARKSAELAFWKLYFGPLRVLEDDKDVGKAMVSFVQCITQPGRGSPEDPSCDQRAMQQRSLDLAIKARTSIAENWNRKLDKLRKP
jgi:hypothetical protein